MDGSVNATIARSSIRHRTALDISLLVTFDIHIAFVAVRDDSTTLSHLNTCKLAFKVQISKIRIFSYCYRFINS